MQPLFFTLPALITLVAVAISVILGVLVYFRGEDRITRVSFFLAAFALAVWSTTNYFSVRATGDVLFWARAVLFVAALEQFSFFFLVHVLTQPRERAFNIYVKILGLLAAVTAVATLTPGTFRQIIEKEGQLVPEVGPFILLFALAIFSFFIIGGIELIGALKRLSGIRKLQVIYIAVGYFIMFTFLITTQFVLASAFQNTFFIQFGPIFTLPFLVLTAYAIFRHQLLNVRVIATELFAGLVVLIFWANAFLADGIYEFTLNSILAAFATLFAVLLVRGTLREIRALQELSDAKTEFINIASHQLRTPLTALKGYLSMMKEGTFGKLQEKQEKTVDKLYATNEAMIRLVNDLLNVSRADQGRLQYVFKELDLRELISGIVDRLRVSAESKGLSLAWDPPKEAVPVIADDDKLAQVISNFIDNSIKYTEHGGITVRISMEESVGGHVMVRVSDTGIGIPKEEVAKLFQRFSRGRGGQRVSSSGAGLGLYIAKTIAEGHKGRVWAESDGEGHGSTFVVELPLATSREARELVSGKKED